MRKVALTLGASIISLSACTGTDNPQLAMCQAVAKQLTSNTVSSWDTDSSSSDSSNVTVKVGFTNSSGQAGNLNCIYPKSSNGDVATAPSKVILNNQAVDGRTLMTAGTKASKELLSGAYKNTVEQSAILAGQAQEKANELAGQAVVKAAEVAEQAKGAAIKGAAALQELQNQ